MATYKELQGFKVRSVSSAPTTDIGQIWYNTTSNTLQFDGVGAGAWASGTNTPVGRQQGGGLGTSTSSAVVMGGQQPSLAVTDTTLVWNGTSWSEGNAITQSRAFICGIGTETAGIAAGGNYSPKGVAEDYNGTSWTAIASMTSARQNRNGCGTASAGLVFGGEPPVTANTEDWNGTSWTEVANMNRVRYAATSSFGAPSNSTTVATGQPDLTHPSGGPTTYTPDAEEWNGTSWTEVANMTLGRGNAGSTGSNQDSMIVYGGQTKSPVNQYAVSALNEEWNGTAWTEVANLATARMQVATSHGTATSALAMAGSNKPVNHSVEATVEEWDGAPAGVQTVTVS